MDRTIRNLDAKTYRAARARASADGTTVGSVINQALRAYLWRPAASKLPKHSLFDFPPTDFGPGTERLSEQIDQVLYGEPDDRD